MEEDYLNKRISHLSSLKNDLEKSPDLFFNDWIKKIEQKLPFLYQGLPKKINFPEPSTDIRLKIFNKADMW